MKTGQYPLIGMNLLLASFILGIICAEKFSWADTLSFSAAGLFLLLGLAVFKYKGRLAFGCLLLCTFFLAAGRMALELQLPSNDVSHLYGQEVTVQGKLVREPKGRQGAEGEGSISFLLDLDKEIQPEERTVSGKIYAAVYFKANELSETPQPGDVVTVTGVIKPLNVYYNPGRIDTAMISRAAGIAGRMSVGKGKFSFAAGQEWSVSKMAAKVRAHYLESLQQAMPQEDAAAVFAMLFGGYEGLQPELVEFFTVTGLVHILSVSGSHITLLLSFFGLLEKRRLLPRYLTGIFAVTAVVLYSILAGCSPPVLRSGAMGILSYLALALQREYDARFILTYVCLGFLFYQPREIFDISFQLSFTAAAGILYYFRYFFDLWQKWGWGKIVGGSIAVTAAAQLLSLPLIVWYFHQFSLISFVANLLVAPLVELIMMFCLAAGLAGYFLPFLAHLVFVLGSILLGLVYELTHLLAVLPLARIWLPGFSPLALAGYYSACGYLLLPEPDKDRLKVFGRGQVKICGLLGCLLLAVFLWQQQGGRLLQVHFLDVGQGNAALVITPHGRAFMIDTGGTRDGSFDLGTRVDVPYLYYYGVNKLEAVFLTHAHEDHAAGAGGIIKSIPVGMVAGGSEGKSVYAKVLQLPLHDERLNFHQLQTGEVWEIDGVKVQVIAAPAVERGKAQTGNEVSNVLKVEYGAISFLFTGDMTKENESKLLQDKNLQASVLQAAHHGSHTSNSLAFLQAVRPQAAVISAGRGNSFGHPHPEVLQRLQQLGCQVLRTDKSGAIVFKTDGQKLDVDTYLRDNEQKMK